MKFIPCPVNFHIHRQRDALTVEVIGESSEIKADYFILYTLLSCIDKASKFEGIPRAEEIPILISGSSRVAGYIIVKFPNEKKLNSYMELFQTGQFLL